MIYFDNNATTEVDPQVLETMLPYFSRYYGNAASRSHIFGRYASDAVDKARRQLAELAGVEKEEIIFTSGSTESINLALQGFYNIYKSKGNHIITVKTEHRAVIDTCKYLENIGAKVDYLNVDREGLIDIEELKKKINAETILACVMLVNNETGVVQPIKEIADITHHHGAVMMCDATQAPGKTPVKVNELGIDIMSLSAHKFYGPKGIGCLYIRRKNPRVTLQPVVYGGGHERGLRSGTLNVPAIVGMGKAVELVMENANEISSIQSLRDLLENELLKTGNVKINGSKTHRAANVTNLCFKGFDGKMLMNDLFENLAVSSGSACSSASAEPSHVLKAMGLGEMEAASSLRFSLGRFNIKQEVVESVNLIQKSMKNIAS